MIFIEKKNINVFKADKNYSAHPLMELYVDFSVMWKNWKPCEVAKNIFFVNSSVFISYIYWI